MKIFGEITKVEAQDDGTIKVAGVASSGAVDEADERVTPEAMKAALPAYMRFGALREMHGLSAAGATLSAEVGEDGATRIEALVVDPVAVKKVQMGVYKGFSIGGKVLARDPADRSVITKLKLNEISLVDRPCNPEATIDMWKADRPAAEAAPSNAAVIEKALELAAAAGKPGRHADFVVKARTALIEAAPAESVEDFGEDGGVEAFDDAPFAVAKLGARNSAADLALIQATHDHMVALGACCGGRNDDQAETGDLSDEGLSDDGLDDGADKAAAGEDLAKLRADNARLVRVIEGVAPEIDDLRRTVEVLQKAPGAGRRRASRAQGDGRRDPCG